MRGRLRYFCIVVVALLASATAAFAQEVVPDEPLMGSEAVPGDMPSVVSNPASDVTLPGDIGGVDGLFRILVIGDDLAGGFGAGVSRMIEGDDRFEVVNRFNEASGLARPELYDWSQATPKILATKEFDALLVHVGVNDRQPMRNATGRFEFRSKEWEAAYRQQVEALIAAAKASNATLYWLALPPMENASFDADMQYLNGIYRSVVTAKGGVFLDIRRSLAGPDGRYVDRGADETGSDRKLRARDGVAFLKQGNNRVGQLILAAIKAEVAKGSEPPEQDNIVVSLDAVAPQVVPVSVENLDAENGVVQISIDTGVPQFGQQGLEGEAIAFTPAVEDKATLPQAKPEATAVAEAATPVPVRKVIMAQSGSKAEMLFTQGLSPDPVNGRFDDFGTVAAP